MSNYTKTTDFAAKDALTSGDPEKVATGTDVDVEFNAISTAIATKEDTANKGAANGYCGLGSGGLVDDSDLSANIPRLNSANVFTGSYVTISSADPQFRMDETDGATNERNWIWQLSSGTLYLRAYNDDLGADNPVFTIERTGNTVDSINIGATAFTWNSVNVGFREIPQNSQSAAYTLVAADNGKHIYHPSADTTARTWTIPANASVAFPIGTAITFVNDTSAGVITIAITSDTLVLAGTGSTGSRSLAANGVATAIKVTSTRWIISGTGLT